MSNEIQDNFDNCLFREPPFCAAACPFGYNVVEFIERVNKGNYASAFRLYRDAVVFPRIVAALCPEPCKGVCPRLEVDAPIDLKFIEQSVIDLTDDTSPNNYNLPARGKSVAVIGSNLGGLGCALRLAASKYNVEIFEEDCIIGSGVRKLVGDELFEREITEQFKFENVAFHTDSEISVADALETRGFDAVYETQKTIDEITALAHGLAVAKEIDVYIRTGELNGRSEAIWSGAPVAEEIGRSETKTVLHNLRSRAASDKKLADAFRAEDNITGISYKYEVAGIESFPGQATSDYLNTRNSDASILLDSASVRLCENRHSAQVPKGTQSQNPVDSIDPATSLRFAQDDNGVFTQTDVSLDSVVQSVKIEAARCLRCRCDACRILCDLTDYYGKWPQRIRDEVFATTLPGSAEVKATPAKRMISTCNLCGVCADVCPVDIDMGALMLDGRRSMHRQEKAPWAFHDFWLRDMKHANGDEANLARMPDSAKTANAEYRGAYDDDVSPQKETHRNMAFFPGCQLCAEDPELVLGTYAGLSSLLPDTGILTRCCGAPAEWSGNEAEHKKSLEEFTRDWISAGEPLLLAACPTCVRELKEYLPQIPVITVYEKLDELLAADTFRETAAQTLKQKFKTWAVFDPCSAGHSPELKSAVRNLALRAGVNLEPLQIQNEIARCCGYGGQPGVANPAYAKFVAKKRVSESDLPYITYCVNCRESFLREGKQAAHILELLFSRNSILNTEEQVRDETDAHLTDSRSCVATPTVSQRRANRVMLKKKLLELYWREEMIIQKKGYDFDLVIPEALSKKLDSAKILEEEIYDVVDFARRTKRFIIDEESGAKSAYHKIGNMTYWVTFIEDPQVETKLTLINAYSHRMSINLEPVWNGVKVNAEEE
jgi:Fe-S oxidoreductase